MCICSARVRARTSCRAASIASDMAQSISPLASSPMELSAADGVVVVVGGGDSGDASCLLRLRLRPTIIPTPSRSSYLCKY